MNFDLQDLAYQTVLIAVPDATRPLQWQRTLSPLLAELHSVGASAQIMVALGLHRPMTNDELRPLEAVAEPFGIPIHQHDASAEDFAAPIQNADAIVCVGVVEPHQYAGFSGGVKTVAIGCAPQHHIAWMHRVELLRDDRVTLGRFEDNPFQQALWKTVADLPPMFGLYQIPNPNGDEILFGPAKSTMLQAIERSKSLHFEKLSQPVDWLHLKVPTTKAQNVYQASRAATYAGLVDQPALTPGGLLIVDAPIPEAMGKGKGELACARAMMRGRDALLDELDSGRELPAVGGAQRAYVIAKTLRRFSIAFVGQNAPTIPALQAMGIPQLPTAEDAIAHFSPTGTGHVVEHPFHAIPTLAGT